MRAIILVAGGLLLVSCAPESKSPPPAAPTQAEAAKPRDESRRFPMADLVDTKVAGSQLLGKPFMPGGTLASYRKGKTEYSMFIAKLPSAPEAALLLLDWHKALDGAKLIPSFGGYFGRDAGRPIFVFTKDAWIAGVAGLPEKEADGKARALAAHLD